MIARALIIASTVALTNVAYATDKVPLPHSGGPNSDGQRWTVTFKADGTLVAVSTCKPQAAAADPSCRYVGSGVWTRKAGMVCYTIREWGGNTGYANPEQCFGH